MVVNPRCRYTVVSLRGHCSNVIVGLVCRYIKLPCHIFNDILFQKFVKYRSFLRENLQCYDKNKIPKDPDSCNQVIKN